MSLPDDLALAHDLADVADEITGAAFTGRALAHERKADGSPVTPVDVAVERAVQRVLGERRPDDAVLGVSTGPALGRRWWGGPELGAWVGDLPRDPAATPRLLAASSDAVGFTTMPASARFRGQPEEPLLGPLMTLGDEVDSPMHGAVLVAAGEVPACLHARGGPWDFAAFAAIVDGAGGRWSDLQGGGRLEHGGPLLYSNGTVHDDLLAGFGARPS